MHVTREELIKISNQSTVTKFKVPGNRALYVGYGGAWWAEDRGEATRILEKGNGWDVSRRSRMRDGLHYSPPFWT